MQNCPRPLLNAVVTFTASSIFNWLGQRCTYRICHHEENPGVVPRASCYSGLHAATTQRCEAEEKCDPKRVKGRAATAETFCSDMKLKSFKHTRDGRLKQRAAC